MDLGYRQKMQGAGRRDAPRETHPGLVIQSPAMRRLFEAATRVAATDVPILILGETGTGKEVLARHVHSASGRAKTRMVALNCAALPAGMVEATLFGHERGAFTGAVRSAAGVFEQAGRGTVFLDEIGELSPAAQAALLRVLETHRVVRVGGEREIEVHARVVAATHRDLERMVSEGRFREDLLYRLNAFVLEVPPLRERREEIVALAQCFLASAAERWRCSTPALSDAARAVLLQNPWPGNVRQLRNVVERALLLCSSPEIDAHHLSSPSPLGAHGALCEPSVQGDRTYSGGVPRVHEDEGAAAGSRERDLDLRAALRAYESRLVQQALERAGGNQTRAAELLKIPRRTLVRKLRNFAGR